MKPMLKIIPLLMLSLTVIADDSQSKVSNEVNSEAVIVGTHQARGTDTFATADFESGFPPAGWTIQQVNPTTTWQEQTESPLTGLASAEVQFDPALVDQDEWLISPAFFAQSGTIDVNHQGSVFWCRDNTDNCDADVMLVVDGIGGGDDILLKTLDEDWPGNFILTATQIDFTAAIPGPNSSLQIAFRYTLIPT